MSYRLIVLPEAERDIWRHTIAGNKQLLRKIETFLVEITEHPRTGTGKPERMRHEEGEVWSRRIDDRHRLTYRIVEDRLVVIAVSAYGHYGDR